MSGHRRKVADRLSPFLEMEVAQARAGIGHARRRQQLGELAAVHQQQRSRQGDQGLARFQLERPAGTAPQQVALAADEAPLELDGRPLGDDVPRPVQDDGFRNRAFHLVS